MNIFLTLISLSFTSIIWSQSLTERYITPVEVPTHIERYNVDYKLVDESVIVSDSSILNQIDLDGLDPLRSEFDNVVVHDVVTNLEVILFYKRKTKITNVLLNTTEQ